MLLTPSPEALLHRNHPNYADSLIQNYYAQLDKLSNNDPSINYSAFFDLSFLSLNVQFPNIKYSPYNSAFVISTALNSNNSDMNLYFGTLALQRNDIPSAMHFIREAVKKGNVAAMNLLAQWQISLPGYTESLQDPNSQKETQSHNGLQSQKDNEQMNNDVQLQKGDEQLKNDVQLKSDVQSQKDDVRVKNDIQTLESPSNVNDSSEKEKKSFAFLNSRLLLYRANKMGSNDAILLMANLYDRPNHYFSSLFYYLKHFSGNHSVYSALQICKILHSHLKIKHSLRKWILYTIACGEPYFLDVMISYSKNPDNADPKSSKAQEVLWNDVKLQYFKRLNLFEKRDYFQYSNFEPKLIGIDAKLAINENINTLLREVIRKRRDFLPSPQPPVDFCSTKYLSNEPPNNTSTNSRNISIFNTNFHNSNCLYRNQQKHIGQVNYQNQCQNGRQNHINFKNEENLIAYFPLKNKTQIVLRIFEFTSSDFKKRNLQAAQILLYNLYNIDQKGILNSKIFKTRITSKNHFWLTSCGFICTLLNDLKSAVKLFLKASRLGNFTATMMCGFLIFHMETFEESLRHISDVYKTDNVYILDDSSLIDQNQEKKFTINNNKQEAGMYFGKCALDPVALIHLGLMLDDPSKIDCACSLLGIPSRIETIVWLMKILEKGVKMPFLSLVPAKMFCLAAIDTGLKQNEDITELLNYYHEHFE
ncbi:hypothetical protein TRFO_17964 [Tritrichomonas foetus]|uniref:Uncharacterized protein n=1 Tax=Tritrichomonas foetus TaxID=1144522 RepID=A0A1J4KRI4_9EUKA|nr:hypothetical protein TRFO_17964 [Tritrichomonas foetus]|eukprot:OHT12278.1 hypothetical protein TRFO_17964 [Tritrichomonas foetus]